MALKNRAPGSHKFGPSVQNQNVNIVKTRLAFPAIDRNAEIYSREVSMIVLVDAKKYSQIFKQSTCP